MDVKHVASSRVVKVVENPLIDKMIKKLLFLMSKSPATRHPKSCLTLPFDDTRKPVGPVAKKAKPQISLTLDK